MSSAKELASRYLTKIKPTLFSSGVGARLPQEYKKFYDEWKNTLPEPVHYIPREGKQWERNEETGKVKRYEEVPLSERIPKELHNVLTGGEVVIYGTTKAKKKGAIQIPHFWMPCVYKSVVYSEILDKYMSVLMTKRAVSLIHKHQGLDTYLLKTRACDLRTLLAVRLKRKLLLALRDKDLPFDEQKKKNIYEKYEKYLLPPEEVEWYGLSFTEACVKLQAMEKAEEESEKVPLKHIYRKLLIEELKTESLSEEESAEKKGGPWFSKIPGISKLKKQS